MILIDVTIGRKIIRNVTSKKRDSISDGNHFDPESLPPDSQSRSRLSSISPGVLMIFIKVPILNSGQWSAILYLPWSIVALFPCKIISYGRAAACSTPILGKK